MTNLAQAFASLNPAEQEEMVAGYFGNKLFGVVANANPEDAEMLAEQHRIVTGIRESNLLKALPADKQAKVLELCHSAEDLLNTPDE